MDLLYSAEKSVFATIYRVVSIEILKYRDLQTTNKLNISRREGKMAC